MMNDLFKPRKTFLKVTETTSRKGIETYCDDVALKNFNAIYKSQLISILTTALELLIEQPIKIMVEKYETEQGEHSSTSETPKPMAEDLQHNVSEVPTPSFSSNLRSKKGGDGNSNRKNKNDS